MIELLSIAQVLCQKVIIQKVCFLYCGNHMKILDNIRRI